jgi:hypothetical protein
MAKPISRRAVFAGTVVALLLMSGGYVIATTLSGISPTQTSQNAGSITAPTSTIFASDAVTSINLELVQQSTNLCGLGTTWSSSNSNASVYMVGTAPCYNSSTSAGDNPQWFEELTWSGVSVPGVGQTDQFFITTAVAGPAYAYASFQILDNTAADGLFTGQLHVYLAAGPATAGGLPNAYTGISIAVSGT